MQIGGTPPPSYFCHTRFAQLSKLESSRALIRQMLGHLPGERGSRQCGVWFVHSQKKPTANVLAVTNSSHTGNFEASTQVPTKSCICWHQLPVQLVRLPVQLVRPPPSLAECLSPLDLSAPHWTPLDLTAPAAHNSDMCNNHSYTRRVIEFLQERITFWKMVSFAIINPWPGFPLRCAGPPKLFAFPLSLMPQC